jgi:titin
MRVHDYSREVICHLTGRLLGLQNEHQRIDRDDYVTVIFTNILPGAEDEFVIDTNSIPFGPYDFESVMHYGRNQFSPDPDVDTIEPLPPYQNLLNRLGNQALSIGDRAAAAYLYGPTTTPLTNIVTTTSDGGFGSLRAAIYYANDHPGTTISFDISTNNPGCSNGVFVIYLTANLPPLVCTNTVIDGPTQPGYTNRPIVALDGSRLNYMAGDVSGLQMFSSNCVVRALAVDHFSDSGIQLLYPQAARNRVEGCFVGLDPDGTNAAPNVPTGVNIAGGAHDNVIGGTNIARRNVISGNAGNGVEISGVGSDRNLILGNFIGLDVSGALATPNISSGIRVSPGAQDNAVGNADTNGVGRNVISGNGDYGVSVSGSNTTGLLILGNYLGTDVGGNFAIANSSGGIGILDGAHDLFIGGTNAGAGNVISGNNSDGIRLQDGASSVVIRGNFIGLNAGGTAPLPNTAAGILLRSGATGNLIGGLRPETRNIVSGNATIGLCLSDAGTSNNVVEGNYFGLNPSGTAAISNGWSGVSILSGASYNRIGGTAAGAANVVAGNGLEGLHLSDFGTSSNVVQGNLIGAGPPGTNAFPNGTGGLGIWNGASGNQIGGATPGAGNTISGNNGYGIALGDPGTSANLIQGNRVGVDLTGTNALANLNIGVFLSTGATTNIVGGTNASEANIIAHNGSDGVAIFDDATTGNTIRGNAIFNNGGLALNLVGGNENSFGVTTNDLHDLDTGPNNLQNFPVLTNALAADGTTMIRGKLQSATNRTYWIDFYRNTSADPSGNGEGEQYLGSTTLITDTNGNGSFSVAAAGMFPGQFITATATDAARGDTSEFSASVVPVLPPPTLIVDGAAWGTNGFSFRIAAQTNQIYRIQAATNLGANPVAWVDLTNLLATNGLMPFTDHAATNLPKRFYRAFAP